MALIAMGFLVVGVNRGNESTPVITLSCILGIVIAMFFMFGLNWGRVSALSGMFVFDQFAGVLKLIIMVGIIMSLGLSLRFMAQEQIARFEYPILVVMAGVGMLLMVSANNMLSLYMGLELQSLSLYVLAAFHRNSLQSAEAGIKYFILGALSSGMLLFGISLIYGFIGSLDFVTIQANLYSLDTIAPGAVVGLVFILAGLAFKISAVPFHMWTPDVYQGAPTSVTAFFAIVPKVAAMALLMRLLFDPFAAAADQWMQVVYFLSVGSMFIGAFAAIAQENIKRLMAYSSIGNMGYAMIGIIAGTPEGAAAVILYMLIYMMTTAGVFAVIMYMRRGDMRLKNIGDLAGLSKNNPGLAYSLAVLMFSMSGIPPLAGFFGKLAIFQAAVAQEHYVLAVLGVLTSVVAAFYYLRIIKVMFFDESADPFDKDDCVARRAVLIASVAFAVFFVLFPGLFVQGAQSAASALFLG